MVAANKINKKLSIFDYPICGYISADIYHLPPCPNKTIWGKSGDCPEEAKYVIWSDYRPVEFVCKIGRDLFEAQYKGAAYPFTDDLIAALNLMFEEKPEEKELLKFMKGWFKHEN